MNKVLYNIVLTIATMMILIVPAMVAGTIETHYTLNGHIYSIEDNVVVIEDTNGNLWEYETNKTYKLGKTVKVKMYNNCTDNNIYDDEIVKIIE